MDANIEFPYKAQQVPAGFLPFSIRISGLKGGHSGLDINLGRSNSNLVLFRLLNKAMTEAAARLCEVEGGNMRNAIPREANAIVIVPAGKEKVFTELVKNLTRLSKRVFSNGPDLKTEWQYYHAWQGYDGGTAAQFISRYSAVPMVPSDE
jgi:dipeptidase D